MGRQIIYMFIAVSALTGCGYDDFDHYEPVPDGTVVPNTTIGFIRSVCGDGVYNVTDDIIIGGYVTADDRSGNIYRSFFIEDGTGAAEIRAGMYSLHNVYRRGRYVSVRLRGLAVTLTEGTLRVGIPPSEGYPGVEYIDSWAVAADYLFPAGTFVEPEPLALSVAQLSAGDCGRLVRFEYMKYTDVTRDGEEEAGDEDVGDEDDEDDEGEDLPAVDGPGDVEENTSVTWAYPRDAAGTVPAAAYRLFEDLQGNRVAVYTSGYATFAGSYLPVWRVSLTGILGYGVTDAGEMYILRLRDEADTQLQVD